MRLACDILGGANFSAVRLVAVPPQVVVADLDVVLLRDLLVLVEARLLEGVSALLVLGRLEHRLVLLVTRFCGDVIAPGSGVRKYVQLSVLEAEERLTYRYVKTVDG